MKLAAKIRFAYLSLASLVLLVGGLAYIAIGGVTGEYRRALTQTMPVVDALQDIRWRAVQVLALVSRRPPSGASGAPATAVDATEATRATEATGTTGTTGATGATGTTGATGANDLAPVLDALQNDLARHRRLVDTFFPGERGVAEVLGRENAQLQAAALEWTHAAPGSAAAGTARDAVGAAAGAIVEAIEEPLAEEERELAEYQANVERERRTLQWAMAASTAAALAIALLVGAFAARRMIRPIVQLRDVAARFAQGHLAARAAVSSDDEVGELAAAFNAMAQDLDETMVSRDYVENVLTRISDGVLVLDADGMIRRANPMAVELLARPLPELIGHPAPQILARATGDSENPPWPSPGHPVAAVFEFPPRPAVYVQLSLVPLLDQDRPAGAVLTVHDVSALKRAEGEMRQRMFELQETNRRLNEAQNQLLQAEKMAAIGQLAAGVAHEINNPVSFISANLGTLAGNADDLLRLLKLYEGLEAEVAATNPLLGELRAEKEASDLSYLMGDLPNLIAECREGTERVRLIVRDLKTFSHVDDGDWQWASLQKCLDSTLNIVWHELKYRAEIVKHYAAVPDVYCLPSQINQVFMNLLVNAGHAIVDRGTITLTTGAADGQAWVEIEDTGTGIPPENQKRIFEPFFTTKPVGKGTGLGLSLAYSIVERHHGRIELSSEVGKGTCFRVTLPIDARAATDQTGHSKEPTTA